MSRPLRIEYEGAFYHITARGNEKRTIFVTERDFAHFLGLFERVHERYRVGCRVYTFHRQDLGSGLEKSLSIYLEKDLEKNFCKIWGQA